MLYLSAFYFPGEDYEYKYRLALKRTSYTSIYPFYVLPDRGLNEIFFKPITILCGGNGCGKSTALNVIAEKLRLEREAPYNRSPFFEDFVDACVCDLDQSVPMGSRIITSDDVFDFMLNVRALNEGVDNDRAELMKEYHELKGEKFRVRSLEDYAHLRKITEARRKTESAFVRDNVSGSVKEQSNGESARMYFRDRIKDDTLCLLDEPENSLSAENQLLLAEFLEESARYCGCQFIISTHSPFLLAMEGARIIDMDNGAEAVKSWTELKNVRAYREFFKKHAAEFDQE